MDNDEDEYGDAETYEEEQNENAGHGGRYGTVAPTADGVGEVVHPSFTSSGAAGTISPPGIHRRPRERVSFEGSTWDPPSSTVSGFTKSEKALAGKFQLKSIIQLEQERRVIYYNYFNFSIIIITNN